MPGKMSRVDRAWVESCLQAWVASMLKDFYWALKGCRLLLERTASGRFVGMSCGEGPAATTPPGHLVNLSRFIWLYGMAQAPSLSSEASATKIGGPLLHLVVRDCLLVLPSSKARQLLRARELKADRTPREPFEDNRLARGITCLLHPETSVWQRHF